MSELCINYEKDSRVKTNHTLLQLYHNGVFVVPVWKYIVTDHCRGKKEVISQKLNKPQD